MYYPRIPPATACQGHQCCGFRIPSAFQQSPVLLSAIRHMLLSCLQRDLPQAPVTFGSRTTEKIYQILSLFPGQQKSETLVPRFPKHNKTRPRNPSQTISETSCFLQLRSIRKPNFKSTRRPNFGLKMGVTSNLETSPKNKNEILYPKSVQNKVRKSNQNQ